MADTRRPDEPHRQPAAVPALEPVRSGRGNGVRIGVAVAILAGVVGLAALTRLGVFGDQGPKASIALRTPPALGAGPSSGPSSPVATPSPLELPLEAPLVPVAPISSHLIATVDDNGILWTMDDGGGSRVAYPAPGVTFGFPTWSPDGSQVAAVGTDADGGAIYVFDVPNAGAVRVGGGPNIGQADGPEPVVIYRNADIPPFYLSWAPGGKRIGFLASEPIGLSLRIAPADGSAPLDGSAAGSTVIAGSPLYFDWLDAQRMLVHEGLGRGAFTGELGVDGLPIATPLPGSGDFRSPHHSADGRYVAFVRSTGTGTGQLVVARPDGSRSHVMPVVGTAAFAFDPSGDTLATIAADLSIDLGQAFPTGPIRLIDPASGAISTLLDRPAVAFFWSPDGRTIAAILPSQPGDDTVTSHAPGGSGMVLAAAVMPRPAAVPAAQLPGTIARLAFIDVASGRIRSERAISLGEHFVNELLPYFDQYARSHRLWSPDSSAFLLPLVDPIGSTREVVIPIEGSATRPVAYGPSGFWSP